MTKNTPLTILIVVLLLIALGLVLGYFVKKETSVTQAPPASLQGETSEGDAALEVLTFRDQDAIEEERARFRELVQTIAKEGNSVTIDANCITNPLVLNINADEPITVQNLDNIEHRLSRQGESAEIVISANNSTAFLISDFVERELDTRVSIIGYSCDGGRSGMFYISPNL